MWRVWDQGEFSGVEEGADIRVRPVRVRRVERRGVSFLWVRLGRRVGWMEMSEKRMPVRVVRPTRAVEVLVSMVVDLEKGEK